jgi:hypothetical protein
VVLVGVRVKQMRKTRKLFLHEGVNEGKVGALRALDAAYRSYLQECIDFLVDSHRCNVSYSEMNKGFFPPHSSLTVHLRRGAWNHALDIVSSWVTSKYTTKLSKRIKALLREDLITPETAHGLRTIGKSLVNKPWKHVTQETLNLFWSWLLDEKLVGKRPSAPKRICLRLNEGSAVVGAADGTSLATLWLSLSTLQRGKRTQIPLHGNPLIQGDLVKDFYLREDKRGRLHVDVCEKKEYPVPQELPKNAPKVGVDVGLNVMASTWDGRNGRLYGQHVKPLFYKKYSRLKTARANRQRQGFLEDSPRLSYMESVLTEMVKNFVGRYSNELMRDYPGHVFVVEDLDLSGTKGQKRFAYRAMHEALSRKVSCLVVNPAYTSQQCRKCGYVSRRNRKSTVFACRGCGWQRHADLNGGANLLGRSEDKEIGLSTPFKSVKSILEGRYRGARAQLSSHQYRRHQEPLQEGPRLTTEGIAGTASTAQPQNCHGG